METLLCDSFPSVGLENSTSIALHLAGHVSGATATMRIGLASCDSKKD